MNENSNTKKRTLPPVRLTQSQRDAFESLSKGSGVPLTDLSVSALENYERGWMVFMPLIRRLLGSVGSLVEDGINHRGQIVSISPPSYNESFRLRRPALHIHFFDDETSRSSIGLWGFGRPLQIRNHHLLVEDFLCSSRESCFNCGILLRAHFERDSLGSNNIPTRHRTPLRICDICFLNRAKTVEDLVVDFVGI